MTVDWNSAPSNPGDLTIATVGFMDPIGIPSGTGNVFKGSIARSAWFTSPTFATNLGVLALGVDPSGGVYLLNSDPTAVAFANLQFQFPESVDLSYVLALLDNATGVQGLLTSGVVPAGSLSAPGSLLVAEFPNADFNDFSARFDTAFQDTSFSPLQTTEVVAVTGAPEAGTFWLVAMVIAGIAAPRVKALKSLLSFRRN